MRFKEFITEDKVILNNKPQDIYDTVIFNRNNRLIFGVYTGRVMYGKYEIKDIRNRIYHVGSKDIIRVVKNNKKADPRSEGTTWVENSVEKKLPNDYKNISDYVWKDKNDDRISKSLEKLVQSSSPIKNEFISYRGISASKRWGDSILESFKSGERILNLNKPLSLTTDEHVAFRFANIIRKKFGDIGIIFKLKLKPGVKVAWLNYAIGVGSEHLISKKSSIEITSITTKKTRVINTDGSNRINLYIEGYVDN